MIKIKLLDELNQLVKHSGVSTYEEIIEKLKVEARRGERIYKINSSLILEEDINRLKGEGLAIEKIKRPKGEYIYHIIWENNCEV
ncbi:hypothetical protein [Clostridium tertium]|uniref:hypothetical protein n=1 Tax=Clostridium tertium TaxID=1559 RepID=UPI0023B2DE1D|nr:hypothetical protein [Clostridium tertium]